MKVKDCMCKKVIYTNEEASITDISNLMKKYDIGAIPVVNNDNNIVGMITDRDIVIRCIADNKDLNSTKAKDIMTQNHIIKLDINSSTIEAEKIMSNNQIRRLPILENNKLIGILSIGDLARNNDVSTTRVGTVLECICTDFN